MSQREPSPILSGKCPGKTGASAVYMEFKTNELAGEEEGGEEASPAGVFLLLII